MAIRTDNLEASQAAVEAAGGAITVEPFDFPGGRRFHFREPGGCELAVWQAAG
ncbi:VOC family protein [Streptomyces sioyaensis]|uniref:VOC family protein n=1 Tax=Streptomyces sioyaensis TaxID=67364 RepID=UPI0036EABD67